MPTNFELKRLKPKRDIAEKPENRVHKLTDSNVSLFGRRRSPFSKIDFLKMFGWTRKVLSQLDQRNLVCLNPINGK